MKKSGWVGVGARGGTKEKQKKRKERKEEKLVIGWFGFGC